MSQLLLGRSLKLAPWASLSARLASGQRPATLSPVGRLGQALACLGALVVALLGQPARTSAQAPSGDAHIHDVPAHDASAHDHATPQAEAVALGTWTMLDGERVSAGRWRGVRLRGQAGLLVQADELSVRAGAATLVGAVLILSGEPWLVASPRATLALDRPLITAMSEADQPARLIALAWSLRAGSLLVSVTAHPEGPRPEVVALELGP